MGLEPWDQPFDGWPKAFAPIKLSGMAILTEPIGSISSPRQKTIFDVAGLMLNDGELFRWSAERIGR